MSLYEKIYTKEELEENSKKVREASHKEVLKQVRQRDATLRGMVESGLKLREIIDET